MSQLSPHFRRLDGIIAAASASKQCFYRSEGLEKDQEIVEALTKAFIDEIAGLTEIITEEPVKSVRLSVEGVLDEIGCCFMAAIDKRDDRNSPETRAAAEADYRRSVQA